MMSLVGGVAGRATRHCPSDLDRLSKVASHLIVQSVFNVIRYWPFEEFSFRKASRELAMAEHFLQNPVRIGGVGVEVEIDECVRPQKTTLNDDQCRSSGCTPEERCHSSTNCSAVHPVWNDCSLRPLDCL